MEEAEGFCGNDLLFPVLLDWNLRCDLIETLLAERLDTSSLLVERSTKSLGDFALSDNFRKLGSLSSPSSDSDVWVFAMAVRRFGNDLRPVRFRQSDCLRDGDVLLVQDCFKLRFIEDLLVNGILSLPENLFLLCGILPCEVKRPYLDLGDLLRIKNAHSHCVGPLIRQMSSDSRAKTLFALPDVDRFTEVVIEHVDAKPRPYLLPILAKRGEKGANLFSDRDRFRNEFGSLRFLGCVRHASFWPSTSQSASNAC